jgi:hypothetical protein
VERRGRAGRHPPRQHGGVRDEPPQQHGLRAGRLPGVRPRRAVVRGGGVGAHLAAPHADPLHGRVLRTPRLGERAVPARAGAVRLHGHAGRRHPGRVPGGRAEPRRRPAPAQAGAAGLHPAGLRSAGRARPGVRARGPQLRPRSGGPHPPRRYAPRASAGGAVGRGTERAGLRGAQPVAHGAQPLAPLRVRVRLLRNPRLHAGALRGPRHRPARAARRREARRGGGARRRADARGGRRHPRAPRLAGGHRLPAQRGAAERARAEGRRARAGAGRGGGGRARLRAAARPGIRGHRGAAHAHPAPPGDRGRGRALPRRAGRGGRAALLRQLHRPPPPGRRSHTEPRSRRRDLLLSLLPYPPVSLCEAGSSSAQRSTYRWPSR